MQAGYFWSILLMMGAGLGFFCGMIALIRKIDPQRQR